jgi:tRNA (cytidine/uridine-2'-O-)-methyltransferase
MFDIVLHQPEIPPNAGNVIRLAANTGARLHLVEPLGFSMDDRQLKRAGLDYHEYARVQVHADWAACRRVLGGARIFALTTRAGRSLYEARFRENDAFVFGAETSGLPAALLDTFGAEARLRIPMRPGNRSLNLSNAVAVTVFEAWRQLGFA